MDEEELRDDVTLVANVEGHNIMAHAWGDKVRKCLFQLTLQLCLGSPPINVAGEKC